MKPRVCEIGKARIRVQNFRVRAGRRVDPDYWPTRVEPICRSRDQYRRLLEHHVRGLSAHQQLLYVANRHALDSTCSLPARETIEDRPRLTVQAGAAT